MKQNKAIEVLKELGYKEISENMYSKNELHFYFGAECDIYSLLTDNNCIKVEAYIYTYKYNETEYKEVIEAIEKTAQSLKNAILIFQKTTKYYKDLK